MEIDWEVYTDAGMSYQKPCSRPNSIQRSGSRGQIQGQSKSQSDLLSNSVRAFNRPIFLHEIESSLQSKESIVCVTFDENDPIDIWKSANSNFDSVFYLTDNSLRAKYINKQIDANVMTIKQMSLFLNQIPDGSCIIIENLYSLMSNKIEILLELVILFLSRQNTFVYITKPIANLSTVINWLTYIRSMPLKIIEAPIERTSVAHFVLSDELRLIRNTTLYLDKIALRESMKETTNGSIDFDALYSGVSEIQKHQFGPILVIFPSNGFVRKYYQLHPECMTIFENTPYDDVIQIISDFTYSESKVLLTTLKVANSILIPSQTVFLTSPFTTSNGKIVSMTQAEFSHLIRHSGRLGVDARGLFVTMPSFGASLSQMEQLLFSDIPSITSTEALSEAGFISAVFSRAADIEGLCNRFYGPWCLSARGQALQDQIAQMAPQIPPDSVSKSVVRLFELVTAISTITTHPANIRSLLVNGRAVRVRSIYGCPWCLCFGDSRCGTVTVAMRDVPKNQNVDDDERCLITLPVHEVIAVGSAITPLHRHQLHEIDAQEHLVESSYDLYEGPLKVHGERLAVLSAEMKEVQRQMDGTPLAVRWHAFAEAILRYRMLLQRKEQQEAMERPDLKAFFDRLSVSGLHPGVSQQMESLAFIIRKANMKHSFGLYRSLPLMRSFSTKETAAVLCGLTGFESTLKSGSVAEKSLRAVFAALGEDCSRLFVGRAEEILDGGEGNFEEAVALDAARNAASSMEKTTRQVGDIDFADKIAAVVSLIQNTKLYKDYFE